MAPIDSELRQKAALHLAEAWAKAEADGVPTDAIAAVALAKAYSELVAHMGVEAAANIAARFPEQIRAGRFGGTENGSGDPEGVA